MSYLKTNHPSLYQEAIKSRKTPGLKSTSLLPVAQSTIHESIEHAQKYEQKGKKWKELTRFDYTLYHQGLPPYQRS